MGAGANSGRSLAVAQSADRLVPWRALLESEWGSKDAVVLSAGVTQLARTAPRGIARPGALDKERNGIA